MTGAPTPRKVLFEGQEQLCFHNFDSVVVKLIISLCTVSAGHHPLVLVLYQCLKYHCPVRWRKLVQSLREYS